MATTAHSAFCFETLSASLEKRRALDLKQVAELWAKYELHLKGEDSVAGQHEEDTDDVEMDEEEDDLDANDVDSSGIRRTLRPRDIVRLQAQSPASASYASTPSTASATSSSTGLSSPSKSSSKSSLFSFTRSKSQIAKEEEYPVFVTWNTLNSRGHKSLRGCIGTFEAAPLSEHLSNYALTAALNDHRFSPISLSELPTLSNGITLLLPFTPCNDPLDWVLGTHGLRISFTHHGRRYSGTYLPDVAPEQGWSKEETVVSLMRKAGWNGRTADWKKISDLKAVRYEGKQASINYAAWREWRDWVDKVGLVS